MTETRYVNAPLLKRLRALSYESLCAFEARESAYGNRLDPRDPAAIEAASNARAARCLIFKMFDTATR